MKDIKRLYDQNPEFRESRLKSLFSDFITLKESNPEGYMANLNTWKQFLITLFETENLLCFQYKKLQKELTYRTAKNDFIPEGLYIALNDMINNDKTILLRSRIEEPVEQNTGILNALKNFILRRNIIDVRNNSMKGEVLVSNKILKEKCYKISHFLSQNLENDAINIEHLHDILNENKIVVSVEDLKLSLIYLSKGSNDVYIKDNIITGKETEHETDDFKIDKSNIEDLRHISDLNFIIYKLQKYNNAKFDEINELDFKIRESIRAKNLLSSKSQLKSKKILEQQVQKTLKNLENLQVLKIKVEEAQNNLMISKVWKQNSNVLKMLNQETEAQDLDSVFDTLYDEIQNTDKISNKLGSKIVEPKFEDDQIEIEIAELEASLEKEKSTVQDKEVEAIEDKLKDLKIPDGKPVTKKIEENSTSEERILLQT
jgi:charged multivesicular body protein 7